MNLLTIIYILASGAIGFLLGITAETCFEASQLARLNKTIERLKLENQALIEGRTEVIEIIDNRSNPDEVKFGGF